MGMVSYRFKLRGIKSASECSSIVAALDFVAPAESPSISRWRAPAAATCYFERDEDKCLGVEGAESRLEAIKESLQAYDLRTRQAACNFEAFSINMSKAIYSAFADRSEAREYLALYFRFMRCYHAEKELHNRNGMLTLFHLRITAEALASEALLNLVKGKPCERLSRLRDVYSSFELSQGCRYALRMDLAALRRWDASRGQQARRMSDAIAKAAEGQLRSNVEAAWGQSRSNVVAAGGRSRSNVEAAGGRSRSTAEAAGGRSRSNVEAAGGQSRSTAEAAGAGSRSRSTSGGHPNPSLSATHFPPFEDSAFHAWLASRPEPPYMDNGVITSHAAPLAFED